MSNSKKPHYAHFGPPIPVVAISDFSKNSLTHDQWAQAWWLCGPSAELNMRKDFRGRGLELWQVIASAYLEGLAHGAGIERQKNEGGFSAISRGDISALGDPVC